MKKYSHSGHLGKVTFADIKLYIPGIKYPHPKVPNCGIVNELKAEQSRNVNLIGSVQKQPQNIV